MSEDKEYLERLAEKVEELLIVLNSIAEDLRMIAASLKSIAVHPAWTAESRPGADKDT